MKRTLDNFFNLKASQTTVQKEVIAGVTTFMTMAYIIVVNPQILSKTGMDHSALVTATILASMIATLIMAFYARLPFGLAPGMGINTFFNIREAIVNSIPINIKHAVSVGIGLFIALIGLNSANVVVTGMEAGANG